MPDKPKKAATLEDLLDAVSEVLFGTDLYRELTPEEEAQAHEILAELNARRGERNPLNEQARKE